MRLIGILLLLANCLTMAQISQRPFTIDDMLRLQTISKVVPAPNGEHFAVVLHRPHAEGEAYGTDLLGGERADIWLIESATGTARNLTEGGGDGSWYWAPVWSPDSQRLAMLTTQGRDTIRMAVWDAATDDVRLVSEAGVAIDTNFGGSWIADRVPAAWISDDELLTVLLPEGVIPVDYYFAQPQAATLPRWLKTQAGLEPSVSELCANSPECSPLHETRLAAVDVRSGAVRVLAEGEFKAVSVSPTRQHAAIIVASAGMDYSMMERPEHPEGWNGYTWHWAVHTELAILSLGDIPTLEPITGPIDPGFLSPGMFPRWSADGKKLAVIAKAASTGERNQLFLLEIGVPLAEQVGSSVSDVAWQGDVLLYSDGLTWHNAAEARSSLAPSSSLAQIFPTKHGGAVGVADNTLMVSASPREAFEPLEALAIAYVSWPTPDQTVFSATDALVVETEDGPYLAQFGASGLSLEPVQLPDPGAYLVAFAPETRTAVYQATTKSGTYLWIGDPVTGGYTEVFHLNGFTSDIADAESQLLTFTNSEGREVRALLALPYDHVEGERYPLIVRVYPGSEPSSPSSHLLNKQAFNPESLLRFLAQGYAVLIPGIPMPEGDAIDPVEELAKNVLPAIEQVVGLGVADPERVGLIGHSYGGYTTLGLLARTDRFKAGLASAAFYDLADYWGTIHPDRRYFDNANAMTYPSAVELESSAAILRMGSPPYEDPERYQRNSPLALVGEVNTPVMLVHPELDGNPMAHAEAYFMALERRGVPARLVRYWGEQHVLTSPANLRDYWERSVSWFDRYLK